MKTILPGTVKTRALRRTFTRVTPAARQQPAMIAGTSAGTVQDQQRLTDLDAFDGEQRDGYRLDGVSADDARFPAGPRTAACMPGRAKKYEG